MGIILKRLWDAEESFHRSFSWGALNKIISRKKKHVYRGGTRAEGFTGRGGKQTTVVRIFNQQKRRENSIANAPTLKKHKHG